MWDGLLAIYFYKCKLLNIWSKGYSLDFMNKNKKRNGIKEITVDFSLNFFAHVTSLILVPFYPCLPQSNPC